MLKLVPLISVLFLLVVPAANAGFVPWTPNIFYNTPSLPESDDADENNPLDVHHPPLDDFDVGQTHGGGWFVDVDSDGNKIWVKRSANLGWIAFVYTGDDPSEPRGDSNSSECDYYSDYACGY